MFFLSNVTEGGEIAFQIADNETFSEQVIFASKRIAITAVRGKKEG